MKLRLYIAKKKKMEDFFVSDVWDKMEQTIGNYRISVADKLPSYAQVGTDLLSILTSRFNPPHEACIEFRRNESCYECLAASKFTKCFWISYGILLCFVISVSVSLAVLDIGLTSVFFSVSLIGFLGFN